MGAGRGDPGWKRGRWVACIPNIAHPLSIGQKIQRGAGLGAGGRVGAGRGDPGWKLGRWVGCIPNIAHPLSIGQ